MYEAKVKYYGNHYFAGEVVRGSKIEARNGNETWLFDDEENYILGLGDFTRYEWVEIDLETLVELKGE